MVSIILKVLKLEETRMYKYAIVKLTFYLFCKFFIKPLSFSFKVPRKGWFYIIIPSYS